MVDKEMTMVERVARAIWSIRREEEDRCDMELEDMGEDHSVWSEARAAIAAMRVPNKRLSDALADATCASDYACLRHEAPLFEIERIYTAGIDAALGGA